MAKLCAICVQQESKYKCPSCRAPYCSAGCYKSHKDTPCSGAPTNGEIQAATATSTTSQSTSTAHSEPVEPSQDQDDDIDPTKLLTSEQLASMQQSAIVKQHLANPRVRELLAEVDASSNRMKALEKALLDPTFSTFMFRALDEIESA